MSPSMHETGAEHAYQHHALEDASWATLANEARSRMKAGFYDAAYLNALGLLHQRSTLTDGQVYSFLCMHALIQSQRVLMFRIEVGDVPSGDKAYDLNNKRLAQLPNGFHARFAGGAGDCDGEFCWQRHLGDSARELVAPGAAPLEVGYTMFSRTYLHLLEEGRVARWPYNDTWITLFYWLDEDHMAEYRNYVRGLGFPYTRHGAVQYGASPADIGRAP